MAGLDAFKENQEVKEIDMSKKVKIGIIGTGWIADSHIGVYKNMPDVEVVAMADLIPGRHRNLPRSTVLTPAKSTSTAVTRSLSMPRRTLTAYLSVPTTVSTLLPLSMLWSTALT